MKKILFILTTLSLNFNLSSQSAGPLVAATNINSGSGANWSISTTTISVNTPSNSSTAFLQGSNFGFTIPANSMIDGIVLKTSQYTTAGPYNDTIVQLLKNGVPVGNNLNSIGNMVGGSKNWGSSSNLWGTTWTAAEINDPAFGFQFKVYNTFNSSNNLNFAGQFSITVYYQTATGISEDTKALDYFEIYGSDESLIINSRLGIELGQCNVSVYNLLGERLILTKMNENDRKEVRINLPEHTEGFYLVNIENKSFNFSKKLFLK